MTACSGSAEVQSTSRGGALSLTTTASENGVTTTPRATSTTTTTVAPAPTEVTDTRTSPTPHSTSRSSPATCPSDAELCLPTHGSNQYPAIGKPGYKLRIETNASQTCVWVRGETDRARGQRIAMLWPAGYHARFEPLRLYDDTGEMIWHERDVRYLWAVWTNGHRDELVPSPCRTDQVLFTHGRVTSKPRWGESTTTTTTTTELIATPDHD